MVSQQVTYLSDLHFDHRQWSSELAFWEDEIHAFEKRLGELIEKCTDNDVLSKAEHFQNAFILHREQIDILKHEIGLHEHDIAQKAMSKPEEVGKKHFVDHTALRESVNMQRKIFREMKDDFFRFLAKYMF